ncbi:MAG: AraC family transcriptional regulator [Dongiaceae bacterium]
MDALSDVLRVIRLTGGVFLDAEFTAPWCVQSRVGPDDCIPYLPQPERVISFHYVVEGRAQLQRAADAPIELRAGEIVLFPHNDLHYLGSAISPHPVDAHALIRPSEGSGLPRIVHGGGGERTHIVCGFLGSEAPEDPLLAMLPPMLTLDVRSSPGGDWIARSFAFAASEVATAGPGAATVLARLSELLFVEAVRRYVAGLPQDETGWLAGLRDAAIGRALALLHGRIAEDWTAETLARAVGLSRSVFASRFAALVGAPPIRYLTSWRLQVAASKLREGRRSVAQIAFEVGYQSEAAFNRAFRREFGVPPATWRRQKLAAASGAAGLALLPLGWLAAMNPGALPLALIA